VAIEETPGRGDDERGGDDEDAAARSEAAARRRRAGRESATAEREPASHRTGLVQFVRECWAELNRVQWPDRAHLWSATAVVIIAVVIVGTYLYALDSVFKPLAAWIAGKQAG
jgi:preprotein translocase subunit SecE